MGASSGRTRRGNWTAKPPCFASLIFDVSARAQWINTRLGEEYMDIDRGIDSAQKAEKVLDALESGKLKLRPQDRFWADQLRVLPRGITGLLNISKLTPDALAIIRATALALTHLEQAEKK